MKRTARTGKEGLLQLSQLVTLHARAKSSNMVTYGRSNLLED